MNQSFVQTEQNPVESVLLDTLCITSESLTKRAERKAITKAQVQRLLELDSPLFEQYERTLTCSEFLYHKQNTVTGEQKLFTGRCKNRWCSVCSTIKTAEMINGYLEPLKQLPELHFVTLTVVSVSGDKLKSRIKEMQKSFTQIKDKLRKKGLVLSGVRKLESNFNPVLNTFNPHYHLIVSGRKESISLIDAWLSLNEGTELQAQNIQLADEGSFKELFKYTVKSLVGNEFHPKEQDIIYKAFKGVRAFQSFGNVQKSPVTSDNLVEGTEHQIDDIDLSQTGEWLTLAVYTWNSYHLNWLNNTNESLRPVQIRPKVYEMLSCFRE
jgi:plasmid rolling circle replication initiator protein Rep